MFGGDGSTFVDLYAASATAGFDPAGGFMVPAEFLFHGEYKRVGNDLKIIGEHGKAFVVHDYFKTDQLHTLFAPNGAALTGGIVAALTGPLASGQYAQAAAPQSAAEAIGRVATEQGSAIAVRNGVAVALNVGDVVLKGDVIQTQGNSSVGIIFGDGTTFDLAANARMVLDDFVYNPAPGSVNSALINLVQGSITFVAGEIAHNGDMKIGTPAAVIGIRGTAGEVVIANNGATTISVIVEPADHCATPTNLPSGPACVGSFNIFALSGQLIGTIDNASNQTIVTPNGTLPPNLTIIQKTPAEWAQGLASSQHVFQTQSIGQGILATQPIPPSQNNQNNQQQNQNNNQNNQNNQPPDQNNQNNQQHTQTDQHPTSATASGSSTDVTIINTLATETANDTAATVGPFTATTSPVAAPVNPTEPQLAQNPTPAPPPPPPPVAPSVAVAPSALYAPQGTAITLSSGAIVTAATSSPLVSATVSISGGFLAGDTLAAVTAGTAVSASYNPATGVLSLAGSDTQEHYQAVLDSVSYSSSSANPTNSGTDTSRTVSWVVNDGALTSSPQITTVTIDNAAVLTLPGTTASVNSGAPLALTGAHVADPDSGDVITLNLSVANGTLAPIDSTLPAGVTVDSSTPGALQVHGSAAAIDQLLNDGVTYTSNNNYVGGDILTVAVHDAAGASDSQQIAITVNSVANQPAVISGTTSGSVTEAGGVNNGTPGTPSFSGTLTDTDVDNPANTFQAVAAGTASDSGYGSYAMAAGGTWTYTLNNNNAAVQALNAGGTLTDTFTVHTQDGTAQQVTVTINGANDAPILTLPGTTASVNSGAPLALTGAHVADPDSGDVITLNLSVANGTLAPIDSTLPAGVTVDSSTPGALQVHGSAAAIDQLLNDGVTYTSNNNYVGGDILTVAVHDAAGASDSQQIAITVNSVANQPAVISGTTSGSVTEAGGVNNGTPGTPSFSGTLTDTDVDNPANTFQAVAAGTASDSGYGSYAMAAGGTWTYTLNNNNAAVQALNAGGTLTDTFTVHTQDGTAQQVTVTINGANDAAVVAGTTSGSVTEAGGVNNGTPGTPSFSGTLTDTDVDNPANTFQAVAAGIASDSGYGSYAMAAGGTWTYTLNNNNAAVQALNAGGTLTDTFTVHTQDGTAQQVTVTINGANDAPILTLPGTTASVNSGAPLALTGAHVADPDSGDVITLNLSVANGTLAPIDSTLPAGVTVDSSTPGALQVHGSAAAIDQLLNDGVTYTSNNNYVGGDILTVAVHDAAGASDSQQIAITVNSVANQPAVISGTTSGSVTEAGGVNNGTPGTPSFSGTLTDTDVDNPANTFQAVAAGTASDSGYGSYAMAAGGTWTYTLNNNNAAVQALNAGGTLTDTFTVHTQDGTAQQVTVTINGANDAAVVAGTTSGSVTEAGGVNNGTPGTPSFSGTLTDTDVDNPANTFQAVAAGTASDSGYGSYAMAAGGTWTYTLNNNNAAVQALNAGGTLTDTFTVHTQDGTAQQVTVTINGANDAAVVAGTTSGSVTEAGGVNNGTPGTPSFSGTLTDTDVDNPANTFQAVAAGTASDSGYGSYAMAAGGTWTYTLNNNNAAVQALNAGGTLTDTFTVHTQDGTAQQVTVTINGANDAAVVAGTTSGSVTEAGGVNNGTPGTPSFSGTLTDTDVDNPANTFQAVAAGTASDSGYGSYAMAAGGTWTYTLNNNNAAVQALNAGGTLTDTFTVHTQDGTAQQVTVTINGANDAAVVSGTATAVAVDVQSLGSGGFNYTQGSYSLGFAFRANSAISITELGYYDSNFTGGAETFTNHDVGIYDLSTNTLLAAVTVGASDPVSGFFHYVSLASPLTLNATDTYAIVGVTGSNYYAVGEDVSVAPINPAIDYLSTAYSTSITSVLLQPDQFVENIFGTPPPPTTLADFGPDFKFNSDPASGAVTEAGGVNNGAPGTPTFSGTLTDTDVDNPANTFQAVAASAASDNAYGTYAMTAGGSWTYTLNNNNAAVQALNVGGTLTDTFTVHTQDGTAQQVTVTINGANDAPVAVNDTNTITAGNGPISGNLLANDSDPENDTLTVTNLINDASSVGTITVDGTYGEVVVTEATGHYTYTLGVTPGEATAVAALAAGAQGQDDFIYTVSDGNGGTANAHLTIAVTGVNDAPALTLPGVTASTNKATPLALTGGHVADPDTGDVITLNLSVANGTLTPVDTVLPVGITVDDGNGADGTVQVHGSAAAIDQLLNDGVAYTPNAGFVGTVTMTVSVQDTAGATDSKQVPINVVDNAALSTPIVSLAGTNLVQEGAQLQAVATISGDSFDLAQTISYQWQSSVDGTYWTNIDPSLATFAGNTSFYQLTDADEGKQIRVVASFTDDTGQLISATSQSAQGPVVDAPPVLSVPFSYAVDEFSITKNGNPFYDNTFDLAPPYSTAAGPPGSEQPITFLTYGSTWSDVEGKAIMSSSGLVSNGDGVTGQVAARLTTNTDPSSTSGLKMGAVFTASGKFDLVVPVAGTSYRLELTDASSVHVNDEVVELRVANVNGSVAVQLLQENIASGTLSVLAGYTLSAVQLANNTQIELDLAHNIANTAPSTSAPTAGSTLITGSFELLDSNGVQTFQNVFTQQGTAFVYDPNDPSNGITWTRAAVRTVANEVVQVAGLAQVGQMLTAVAVTNDANNAVTYQWMENNGPGGTYQNISGATGANYVLQDADMGRQIEVKVTATNSTGTVSETSAPSTSVVAASSYFWGNAYLPTPKPGVHISSAAYDFDSYTGAGALFYYSIGPSQVYNPLNDPAGPYAITRSILPVDPFYLPTLAGVQIVMPALSLTLPSKTQLIVPSIITSDGNGTQIDSDGIAIFETQGQVNGQTHNLLYQVIGTGSQNGDTYSQLTLSSPPTLIVDAGSDSIYSMRENYRQDYSSALPGHSGSYLSSYDVAWDQYTSTGSYSLHFEIFNLNADGTPATPSGIINPAITPTGGTSLTASATAGVNGTTTLPAWQFRNAGGIYVLAVAERDSIANKDFIQFKGYNTDGSANTNPVNLVGFTVSSVILPVFLASNPSATNHITQDLIPSLNPLVGSPSQQLAFVQDSVIGDYFIGWNETITDSSGSVLGDEVEFAVRRNTFGVNNVIQYQVPDAQNIRVATFTLNGTVYAVLVYGDGTTTHLVEFQATSGANVTQTVSITENTNQAFSSIENFGDGRIAVNYVDVLDATQTSQEQFTIYDFRTTGLNINDSTLADGQNKYFAGTYFNDTVIGENNVNNFYDYVGSNQPGAATDIFTGGSNGWNAAIFADARANYSIVNGVVTANAGNTAHAGTLITSNVQALAFDPAHEPVPHSDGSVEATGDTLVILNTFSFAATIDPGATLELATADSGSVTFAGVTGTLRLDSPTSFGNGHIDMLGSGNVLDLKGYTYDPSTTVTPGSFANGTTTLTVSETGHQTLSFTLAGDYSNSTWALAIDNDINSPGLSIHSVLPAVDTAGGTLDGINLSDQLGVAPTPANSLGLFTVTGGNGGEVDWHFNASNSELIQLADQTELFSVTDQTNTAATQTISVSVGANDQFSFQINAGTGTHAMMNFSAAVDQNSSYVGETISLVGFTNAQGGALTVNDILADLTSDSHGNAVVNLNNHDSITFENVTASIVQAQAANLFHFGLGVA